MIWEIEIQPKDRDAERTRVGEEHDLLTHTRGGAELLTGTARGYLIEGEVSQSQAKRLTDELLVDPLVETGRLGTLNEHTRPDHLATVLLKPGVMDPTAFSVVEAARDLGIHVQSVRTFRRYFGSPLRPDMQAVFFRKVLATEAIEQVVAGPLALEHLDIGSAYQFRLVAVPLRDLDDAALEKLSRDGQLSLSLAEMRTIQAHFREQGRDPTDVELETLAQTWSEHCSHKTLKGRIEFAAEDGTVRRYDNLLKETIFGATQEIRRRLGGDDWCVSVFADNAGVVRFNDRYHVCFKVETHNHPSAIEPYGGANTGLGGVIRDPLGTGLGAKPICNTDVFCFAPPDTPPESLPPGVLHPVKVMKGVVAGVRDYGNRMGIPTVNGAVCFDERYLGNPLVYCGTVGLIPVDRCVKEPCDGDLIVAVGGRTGRDGIHGATFSSVELTSESERVSGGAVQIGNAIAEKKLLDVLLQARDAGLYHAITDCGAGGFSSAVGEMAEGLGASVQLDQAPLKYAGLSYTEIWISEAQERMVLAVSPAQWPKLQKLCAGEDVEATVLGRFEATGRLRLFYQGEQVADLDMRFLHDGRPPVVRQAIWRAGSVADSLRESERTRGASAPHSPGLPSVEVNINLLYEARSAVSQGAAGVGLYRSEFLFLARRTLPTEDEQVGIYRKLLQIMAGRPVTIRTFDLRPDKLAAYSHFGSTAARPFDWRLVLQSPPLQQLLRDQVRAILRASTEGPVRILVPLVTSSELLDFVLETVTKARDSLTQEGLAFSADVPLGVMIEVAAAASLVSTWAEQVSFFAVGTNDLAASALGFDRDDPLLTRLADTLHPGLVRLIHDVVEDAHAVGRPVSVCGEIAADPLGALVLAALGVDTLSVPVNQLDAARQALAGCEASALAGLKAELLRQRTTGAIRMLLQESSPCH
ncbi:MAG TPA: putative PEP-binding protein [Gemmataceae bacterium]